MLFNYQCKKKTEGTHFFHCNWDNEEWFLGKHRIGNSQSIIQWVFLDTVLSHLLSCDLTLQICIQTSKFWKDENQTVSAYWLKSVFNWFLRQWRKSLGGRRYFTRHRRQRKNITGNVVFFFQTKWNRSRSISSALNSISLPTDRAGLLDLYHFHSLDQKTTFLCIRELPWSIFQSLTLFQATDCLLQRCKNGLRKSSLNEIMCGHSEMLSNWNWKFDIIQERRMHTCDFFTSTPTFRRFLWEG